MRLEAGHDKERRHRLVLCFVLLAGTTGACTKTWMLGAQEGAGGGAGNTLPAGSGGFWFPNGSGGFPGPGGSHGDTGGHGAACTPSGRVTSDVPTSNMVFLVGRDASMSMKLNGSGDSSRMSAIQSQLKSVIMPNQFAVRFGYQGFPSLVGCQNGMACCVTGTEDGNAPPQKGAAFSILPLLTSCPSGPPTNGCTSPNDARPVAQALQTAEGLFGSSPKDGDRSVVLIVDGAPGCPGDDPGSKCTAEKQWVATLYNEGIRTYVIEIGDAAQADTCLQQIAAAGSSTSPYAVDDVASLTMALSRVTAPALAAACTVELMPNGYDPTTLSVRLSDHDQDHEIPFDYNGHEGWSFANSWTRIKINGSYCDSLKASQTLTPVVLGGCPPCLSQQGNCD